MIAPRLTFASTATLLLCGILSTACSRVVPPRPVPLLEARKQVPKWFPEKPWNAADASQRVWIKGKVVFHTAKATIRPEAERILQELLVFLNNNPDVSRIRLEGHTDWRAEDEYNQGLSKRRAIAVANWLVDHGLDHERILAVAFGESRPLWRNELGKAAMQENRRTAFAVAEVMGNRFRGKDPTNGGLVLYVKSKAERDAEAKLGKVPEAPVEVVKVELDVIKPDEKPTIRGKLTPTSSGLIKPKVEGDGDKDEDKGED